VASTGVRTVVNVVSVSPDAARSLHEATVVTSFVLHETVQSEGKPTAEEYFVVDIWSKK